MELRTITLHKVWYIMLKLIPEPKFKADVPLTIPGKPEPVVVSMTFKYMTRQQFISFMEDEKDRLLTDTVGELITGWDGFDAEYSRENLNTFFEHYPNAPIEIWREYNKQLFESRVKN